MIAFAIMGVVIFVWGFIQTFFPERAVKVGRTKWGRTLISEHQKRGLTVRYGILGMVGAATITAVAIIRAL
ncbi:MAG TPA: hypothetical protein VF972_03895 [Actinomycetota bacterium]